MRGAADITRREKPRLKSIINKMTVDFDMLRTFMKDRVSRNMNGSLTIRVEQDGTRNQYTKIPRRKCSHFNSERVTATEWYSASAEEWETVLLLCFPRNDRTTREIK